MEKSEKKTKIVKNEPPINNEPKIAKSLNVNVDLKPESMLPESKVIMDENEQDIRKIQQKILGEFKQEMNKNKQNKKSKKKN